MRSGNDNLVSFSKGSACCARMSSVTHTFLVHFSNVHNMISNWMKFENFFSTLLFKWNHLKLSCILWQYSLGRYGHLITFTLCLSFQNIKGKARAS